MDRNSIASTSIGSDHLSSEFYDTPRLAHHHEDMCGCCHSSPTPIAPCSHSRTQNNAHPIPQAHPSQNPPHFNQPRQGSTRTLDPMENYDNVPLPRSVNGEGKMPLMNASQPLRIPIYAIVDKTKKAPKPTPHCDTIYENQKQAECQPTYMNTNETVGIINPPAKQTLAISPTPTTNNESNHNNIVTTEIQSTLQTHTNYVNMEFAQSLQLYENAHELAKESASMLAAHDENLIVTTTTTTTINTNLESNKAKECLYENTTMKTNVERGEHPAGTMDSKISNGGSGTCAVGKVVEKASTSSNASSGVNSATVSRGNSEDNSSSSGGLGVGVPMKRSSSVPCKGGHANRGSASSSDSGVSGDCALFFEDSSPMNDLGR